MRFEAELFKKYTPDFEALKNYGFKPESADVWLYKTEIQFGQFQAIVQVQAQREVSISVFDSENTEYSLIHVESANGEFVSKVRAACEQLLLNIREACFIEKRYLSEQTERIVAAIKLRFQEETDDPWNELHPGYSVFRNVENRKWYALLMNVDGTKVGRAKGVIEILNVKAAPELIQRLLMRNGFYYAYHMNHTLWISIILDESIPDQEIMELVASSRKMTAGKRKKSAH